MWICACLIAVFCSVYGWNVCIDVNGLLLWLWMCFEIELFVNFVFCFCLFVVFSCLCECDCCGFPLMSFVLCFVFDPPVFSVCGTLCLCSTVCVAQCCGVFVVLVCLYHVLCYSVWLSPSVYVVSWTCVCVVVFSPPFPPPFALFCVVRLLWLWHVVLMCDWVLESGVSCVAVVVCVCRLVGCVIELWLDDVTCGGEVDQCSLVELDFEPVVESWTFLYACWSWCVCVMLTFECVLGVACCVVVLDVTVFEVNWSVFWEIWTPSVLVNARCDLLNGLDCCCGSCWMVLWMWCLNVHCVFGCVGGVWWILLLNCWCCCSDCLCVWWWCVLNCVSWMTVCVLFFCWSVLFWWSGMCCL